MAQTLTIQPVAWGPSIAALIARCAPPDGGLEDIRDQIETGRATLFAGLDETGQLLLAAALRIDQTRTGPEGVVVALAWENGCIKLALAALPAMESLCVGVKSWRIHTIHASIARLIHRQGYGAAELVLRKKGG